MASTFSPILRIELIGTGDQSGTWGNTTNVNLGTLIEQAIAGTSTIDVSLGNVTLTNFNGTSDEARCMALRVIGTPGVSRNIVAPAVSKIYVVANGSNAAVVLKTAISTGLTIASGDVSLAYYDTTSADFVLVGKGGVSTNTPNTLVLRDGSGNFAAGVVTVTGINNTGDTTLGDTSGDTLTVNATPTFNVAIPVTSGGTGVTTATGTGSVVRATSPTLVTPILGTPTSGTLTNCTGLPISTGVSGLGTGIATFLATPSSANLASAVTDETGTGALVFATSPTISSPTLVTPVLGTPTSGTLTNCTGLPISSGVSGLGTGVATALAVNTGLSGAVVVNGGALGTPSSGTLTNTTGLPISTGVSGLGSGVATALGIAANGTGGFVTDSGTVTLTNKRITQRVVAAGSTSGTITPTGDTADLYTMLGLTGTITIATPSGTPTNGQKLMLRIRDNGTARTINWTTSSGAYRALGVTLPTTTVANKLIYVGCIYNSTDTFWDVVSVVQQA